MRHRYQEMKKCGSKKKPIQSLALINMLMTSSQVMFICVHVLENGWTDFDEIYFGRFTI